MWSLSTGGEDHDRDAVAFGSAREARLPLNGVLSTATLREEVGQGGGDASTEGSGDVSCRLALDSMEAVSWHCFSPNVPLALLKYVESRQCP